MVGVLEGFKCVFRVLSGGILKQGVGTKLGSLRFLFEAYMIGLSY